MMKMSLGAFALGLSVSAAVSAADVYTPLDLSGLPASNFITGKDEAGKPAEYRTDANDRIAKYAFDGSGLSADGTTHGSTANGTMFMSSAFVRTGVTDNWSFPLYLQADFGAVRSFDRVTFFNFNMPSYTTRGVKEFDLYVSSGETWETSVAAITSNYTKVLSGTLGTASGADGDAGRTYDLETRATGRYAALVIRSSYARNDGLADYPGISEIRFLVRSGSPAEQSATSDAVSFCCVGDSITEGANSSTAANKWTYRLYLPDLLAAQGFTNVVWKGSHVSSWSGSDLPSEGWCGNSAEQIADRYIAAADADKADFLLLHSGHNYDATVTDADAIVAAVTNAHARIIAAARARNPRVVVLEAKVVTSGKLPKYGYIPALNEAIGALSAELGTVASPVVAVDMADGWDYTVHCIGDLVHPTEAGARLMAEKWLAAIRQTLVAPGTDVLVEAESFSEKGGWSVDPQFADVMGSPYLLAHGRGERVADATTKVGFAAAGRVRAWVRTRDWTPDWDGVKPGRFLLSLGGRFFPNTLGVAPSGWGWADAGVVEVEPGVQTLALRDLTGFDGRCDAVFLTDESNVTPPPAGKAELAAWRAAAAGESGAPTDVVSCGFVVVGGGIAGTAAAIAAAEAGVDVVVVQDRPMLGGNASDEIRVRTEKEGSEFHWIVKAIRNTVPNGGSMAKDDTARMNLVSSYTNLAVHTGWRAYGVVTNAAREIVAVDARHVETGARRRFVAPLYCDATGDGWLGYWAGAAYMLGREAKGEYDEPAHGQAAADTSTMGNSLLWTTKTAEAESVFPSVPWATKVSGSMAATEGGWQWEAGLDPDEDTIDDAEMLRDRLLRAAYGCFSNAKAKAGNERLAFDFLGYIAGKRESRRIVGDYVVREKDVTGHRPFEDAIGIATWSVDLHRKDGDSGFLAATTHYRYGDWWMPYRSLCCRDVPNLFLAGRCASYTHVAFGSSRVMHAGGQQGVAVGYAASLCRKYGCLPREIYRDAAKTDELRALVNEKQSVKKMSAYAWPEFGGPIYREVSSVVVDNADASGVEVSGAWKSSTYSENRVGDDYLHNDKTAGEDLWVRFTPDLPSNGVYEVALRWNGDDTRGSRVPVEIVHADGVTTNYFDMTPSVTDWSLVGRWNFAAGTSGSLRLLTIGQSGKTVIADAVRFTLCEVVETTDDSDLNGLPDAWERRHFLQLTGTDPDGDPDGDGLSNRYEFVVGADPNVVNLPFAIDGIVPAEEDSVTLVWKGVAGRRYQVMRAGSPDGAYTACGGLVVPESDGVCTAEVAKEEALRSFFRITVSR